MKFELIDGFYVSQNGLLVGKAYQSFSEAMESDDYNKNGLTTWIVKIKDGKKQKADKAPTPDSEKWWEEPQTETKRNAAETK